MALAEALAPLLVALYSQLLRPPNNMGDGKHDAEFIAARVLPLVEDELARVVSVALAAAAQPTDGETGT